MEPFNSVNSETAKPEMSFSDEPMDTNETPSDGYCEEGEISSSEDEKGVKVQISSNVSSVFSRNFNKDEPQGFVTGFNIFDKDETLKKLDRAKRFALPIKASSPEELHREQLSSLYRDLGIDKENERHYRFNAIHMRGTENMSTEDVLEYFMSYVPSHVEWINDVSCNVIWMDDISAARALLNLSKRIKNLDKVHLNADPFEKDFKDNTPAEEVMDDDSVDARDIKAAIPPGFWRIGVPSNKSSFILLRFATRSDRKQRNAEKISEYYKKHGNPNYGNIPGLISNSLRSEIKRSKYKTGNFNIFQKASKEVAEKKNPWEDLAYEWGETDRVEETHGKYVRSKIFRRSASPEYKPDIPDLRISLENKKERGKRIRVDSVADSPEKEIWESRSKIPRMKMYADDEEKKIEKNSDRRFTASRYTRKPVEDLRSKITRKKNRERFKFKMEKEKQIEKESSSESAQSGNEYDDGDSGEWALEHYHDLRESLQQNKKQGAVRYNRVKHESDSENSDVDSYMYKRHLGQRSPLQIQIDNDEYYLNKE